MFLAIFRRKTILIRAFERFLGSYPDAELVIVGGRHEHDRRDCLEYFRGLVAPEFSGRVFFTDFVDERSLDRLVLASDIVVVSSLERYFIEASGALARVACFGKPVICTRVPKFEAELRDGEDCVMTSPGDVEGLAGRFCCWWGMWSLGGSRGKAEEEV
jgi:glycosyltransferase involved in cell wall biosynthesis